MIGAFVPVHTLQISHKIYRRIRKKEEELGGGGGGRREEEEEGEEVG